VILSGMKGAWGPPNRYIIIRFENKKEQSCGEEHKPAAGIGLQK